MNFVVRLKEKCASEGHVGNLKELMKNISADSSDFAADATKVFNQQEANPDSAQDAPSRLSKQIDGPADLLAMDQIFSSALDELRSSHETEQVSGGQKAILDRPYLADLTLALHSFNSFSAFSGCRSSGSG